MALGLKEAKDFHVRLAQLTPEELTKLHQVHSFKIGGAMTGSLANGMLMCVAPSNVIGTTLNIRQLIVALRSRRKIEEAAKAYHGRNLREGSNRASKKRHVFAGAALKGAMTVLFLGHDDFVAVASELFGMDLASPSTAAEVVIKKISEMFSTNSVVDGVRDLAGHFCPVDDVIGALGFEQNPTWCQLYQEGGMSFVAEAGIGIGVAAEASLVPLAADAAGERLYEQTLREGNQCDFMTAAPANARHDAWAHSGRWEAAPPQRAWS